MKRILVVDDSAFMRLSIKHILTRNGYQVIGEADNGRLAVEMYKELSPDIVTLDVTMKEMSGIEALKEIMEYDSSAVAIMMSAMGQKWIVEEALKNGAKGFFLKPFDEEKIVSVLEKF